VTEGRVILIAGVLMALALLASLLASRIRVPGLLLFLGLGMAVGSDGLGWIDFSDYELARDIGVIALALILFEGGLAAGFGEIRPVLGPALALAIGGTLVTAAITGLAAAWLFDLSTLQGLLLGSVVASTDAAAIFAVLRGSQLRRALARTLEGEAGMNDPVAILLVLGFIDWIQKPGYGALDMAGGLVLKLGVGIVVGLAVGWLAIECFRRLRLSTAGLYPVASITAAAIAFGLAEVLHGSGFLSVYLCGLVLGSRPIPARRTVTAFHEGVAVIAELAMFLTLGLLVFPSELGSVAVEGTALALVLALVARPIATFLATIGSAFSVSERTVLGWAGLRGGVPVVLATFPVIAGIGGSGDFFNIVFFAVVVSTFLQGTTFEWVAGRLGATRTQPALPQPLAETGTIRALGAEVVEYPIAPGDAIVGARVRDLSLPREALVNVIVRGQSALPPRGSTVLEAGDRLHILVRSEFAHEVEDLLTVWREGPVAPRYRARRQVRGSPPIFTVRRWESDDGDAANPASVLGVEVVELLRSRHDVPGALVALADGRYAFTGPVVAVGSARQLQAYAARRQRAADGNAERAWWQEGAGALIG
jgi:cell volume regulation protein A